ncbi:efflux RND transporter permease subunit [Actinosynnema sp. NPDC047251]|uniref:Acriflavin resistance protein n=1 Tax=Saccharothrix espanaensis (strain ATCC 51144 / DSM 44229 / JCM 9112 / NBRC 15066 / NRRL 15764) TaxID=1179773 RepID=K0K6W1_SACES|nr:efflux RND transporter permease subunit [Saccharothrix espanaensis]CCH32614.1 Acriflavin resistance protein [Saccharothrix espanaensis DSM 44229]
MMRWIVRTSLKLRFLVVVAASMMMFFGVLQLQSTPVDAFPEFAPPRVEIQTTCIGLSARDVEELVSVPMEQGLNGIEGLTAMRSKSVSQLSSIVMIFTPGTDLMKARLLIQERLNAITPRLPRWANSPFMIQPLSSTSRVMKIGISQDDKSDAAHVDMALQAYWTIRPRLMRIPGVANAAIWGDRWHVKQALVDPDLMKKHNVTMQQVLDSAGNAVDVGQLKFKGGFEIGTGGYVDTANNRFPVQHQLPRLDGQQLAEIPIETAPGAPRVYLKDVAEIRDDVMPPSLLTGDAVINDGLGIMMIIEKLPWGNTLEVTHGVEQALRELAPGMRGLEVDTEIFRPATFIEQSVDNLGRAMLFGFGLVVLILIFFLFEWRVALISAITIPLSLVAAGLVLHVAGATINVMILAGLVIALGVLVDDAIIDIENIVRRIRQHRREGSDKSTARIVLEASLEVRGPIVHATMIILVSIVPVFMLGGLTGSFFRPLAFAYGLSILASLVVALTVIPALALMLLAKAPIERHHSPLVTWLQRGYTALLARIIPRPGVAYSTVAVVLVAGMAALPLLGNNLLPSFKERDFLMHWVAQPGASREEMVRITQQVSKELRAIPGVRNFGAHIGQGTLADEVVGMNFTENWISISPDVDYDTTVAAVQQVVNGYPGLQRDVQTYLKERTKEVLTGGSDAIIVRIYGDDLEVLREKANAVKESIDGVDGIKEAHVTLQTNVPQVHVEVDLQKASRYGITPGEVRRTAAAFISSEEAGDIWRNGKNTEVHVWSHPKARYSVEGVRALLIDSPGGGKVPIGDLAEVKVVPSPNQILRENGSRRIDVGANVKDGAALATVAQEVEERMARVQYPAGYHAELIGEYKEARTAQDRLLLFSGVAVLGILFLLATAFNSWRLALLVLLTLPMALVGGVLGALLTGGILSLGSLVGFFTVLGIAARNGILMINHFQHLEREEGQPFGEELVLRGALERLAPILMTSLAAGLALVPLAVAGDLPGHEIEHPMAIVIIGGLFSSTLLNLFVTPSLYLKFGGPRRRRRKAEQPEPAPA